MLALLLLLHPAAVTQTDLFAQGENGVHTYRIPALVETRKGTLLAAADARHDGTRDLPGRISLVLRRSADKGKTWSPMVTIRQVPASEGGVGDPSLLLDRSTGRVWCFHAYGATGVGFFESTPQKPLRIHAIYSDDDGRTWSPATDLTQQLYFSDQVAGIFVTSGTNIQTRKGRMLLPLVVRMEGDRKIYARNAYSDDHGKSWRVAPTAIEAEADESHNVELADGTIIQNIRPSGASKGQRLIARSNDGGLTFTPATPEPQLPDPACNAGIARHPRAGLLFTNAASAKIRERLTLRLSPDEGKSWKHALVLHEGPAAYSTVIVLRDGSIGVLYERGMRSSIEKITFARVPLQDLLESQ